MCDCHNPVQHSCGAFGEFKGIAGGLDVYYCRVCDGNFRVVCRMLESAPEIVDELRARGIDPHSLSVHLRKDGDVRVKARKTR